MSFLKPSFYLTLIALFGCQPAHDEALENRSAKLHSDAIVIDTHSDFLDRSAIDGTGIDDDIAGAQTTISKLKQGEVDAQFFSVFVPPAFENYGYAKRADELIDRLELDIAAYPADLEKVDDVAGIEYLANSGKTAALMGIEGGHVIENDRSKLQHFYARGVRYMTLTWSNSNEWADSSGDTGKWGGLTEFGREVVLEMNRLGMMVDISHVSDDTFWDVIKITRSPVIASHSAARGEMDHKRNMSDDMIRAVAKNGGVIQVSFYAQYVDHRFYDDFQVAKEKINPEFAAIEAEYGDDPIALDKKLWAREKALEFTIKPVPAARVIDHIDHIVDLVGVDHVGLGSDYDGMGAPPIGLEHIGKISTVTDELVRRGYSDPDIKKILGGNLMRVFLENEKRAIRSD